MKLNLKTLAKSPQALISLAAAVVVALGTTGIISTNLSAGLQTLLGAVLTLATAAGHTAATTKLAARIRPATPAPAPAPVTPASGS